MYMYIETVLKEVILISVYFNSLTLLPYINNTTLNTFSTQFLVMCKVYADVGGIK